MTRKALLALSREELFKEMDRAYARQAHVVDNFGSDDDSYAAENYCNRVEAVMVERGLCPEYRLRGGEA